MELFAELFSDWAGILSFGVIAVTVIIAIVFAVIFLTQSSDPNALREAYRQAFNSPRLGHKKAAVFQAAALFRYPDKRIPPPVRIWPHRGAR